MLDAIGKDINHDFISFYTKGFEDGVLAQKEIFIKKIYEWLEHIAEYTGHDSESIKESFKKYINGCD